MKARSARSSFPFALLFVSATALAAPPVAGPAEPHGPIDPCTVANYEEPDVTCELCARSAKDGGACARRLAGLGYLKKCETRHEVAEHGEVWCKSQPVATAPKPGPEETQHTLRLVVLAAAMVLAGVVLYFRKDGARGRT